MQTNAIDVSKHQGRIDWPAVSASGVTQAMLRIGYGRFDSQVDATFETNYQAAKAAGVAVGGYWYSYAVTPQEAREEAACCLRAIQGKQFELPIAYDIEYEPGILALTTAQRTALVQAFLGEIQAAGYYGMLYASTDFIRNKLNWQQLTGYDVWAAQYSPACSCPLPYGIWQYTSSGSVPGIEGRVDCNRVYKDYPGIIKGAGVNGWGEADRPKPEPEPPSEPEGPKPQPPAQGFTIWGATDGQRQLLEGLAGFWGLTVTR